MEKSQVDVWETLEQIHWRTSQRIVVLTDFALLPIRLELARIDVPIGQHLICRRLWQLATIFVEGTPAPQSRQVTDPSWLELQLAAGAGIRFQLAWRRFDDDRGFPGFPEDTPAPFDTVAQPIDGWDDPLQGKLLFPWGVNAPQRIEVPGGGALSLFVDLDEDAGDVLATVGGLLQGEVRTVIDTPDFRAWFGRS